METLVFWSTCSRVNKSGIAEFAAQSFYKGKWVKKISVLEVEIGSIRKGDECLFWVEFLSMEEDNMVVKYLKNYNQKLTYLQAN